MRICSPQLGLNPKSTLGGEVFDREILLGLAKRGVFVDIILPVGKPHDKGVKNWSIYYIPIKHFPAIFGNLFYIFTLLRIYNKTKFEVLRLHQPQFLVINAIIFKIFHPRVKIMATYHQFGESNFFIFSKAVNNLWDLIICDSENVKSRLIHSYKINTKKITVVHNGVPVYLKPQEKNKHLLKEYKLQNKFVLMFMGFLIDRKNPLFLLDVLKQLISVRNNVVLIFWGQGNLKTALINRSAELNISHCVRFIGPVFGEQKTKIHNLADIFVHPSLDEGFALAPLEAMACGKPIIMNNTHSAKEAISGNGFLCQTNNIKDWVKHIQLLFDDAELLSKMGRISFKRSKEAFSWRQSVERHQDALSI